MGKKCISATDNKNICALGTSLCVFLKTPFQDCHCVNITSMKIPRMLEYCSGDYKSCPIFKRNTEFSEKKIMQSREEEDD